MTNDERNPKAEIQKPVETIEVRPETLVAVRLPMGVDAINALNALGKKLKPPGATVYVRGGGKWFFLETGAGENG
jgi:hypothetical protein